VSLRANVQVPGSSANLGSGFDCIAMAVQRTLSLSATVGAAQTATRVERAGTLRAIEVQPHSDLIVKGFRAACESAGRATPHVHIRATSDIPVARGLGSSAAATVAGVAAANALLGLGFDDARVADVAVQIEGHPDNVAASVFGGATLALVTPQRGAGMLVVQLRVSDGISLVLAVPPFQFETARARALLPEQVPHTDARRAAAHSAALVHGLATGDPALLALGLDDVLHVPYRRGHIHGYDAVTDAARDAGAFGATLSGSGSTLVAVAPAQKAQAVTSAMHKAWSALGVEAECFTSTGQAPGYSVSVHRECPEEAAIGD
jgi:homoserine kinase